MRAAAPTSGDPAPSRDADEAVLAEQLRVLYIEGERLILTGVAAALILVWVLWDQVPHAVLLGWLAVFGVYSLARAAMARAYRHRTADDTDHRAWMRRVQWALAVGGSIWAAACFLFYVPDRIEYQLFLVTMLLGAVVSGLVTLAVYLPAYLAFVTPFVGATVIRYGLEGDPLHWGIALAAIVTLFLFINFARYIQKTFVESLRLRMALAGRNRELGERNREVERANLAKSRFLAAASHDLRQPLHALNLFAAQLGDQTDPAERARLVARIDAAIESMNELFNALLDISKLDAGVLAPDITEFPVGHLLGRIETTFAATAREKGLRLASCRAAPGSAATPSCSSGSCSTWCRTPYAIRPAAASSSAAAVAATACASRCGTAGPASPRTSSATSSASSTRWRARPGERAGLGLGLVDRRPACAACSAIRSSWIAAWQGLALRSVRAAGAPARQARGRTPATSDAIADPARDKLVVVIDDDALVLDGMRGMLQSWGCRVVAASSDDAALAALATHQGRPNLIISDYLLAERDEPASMSSNGCVTRSPPRSRPSSSAATPRPSACARPTPAACRCCTSR